MTSPSVLRLSLRYGLLLTGGVAVVGSLVGLLVAGVPGLVSALLGAALAAVFMGLTGASVAFAQRATRRSSSLGVYFGIISGAWLGKMIVFVLVSLALIGQPWLDPYLYFFSTLAAVIGSLVADALALQRARVPYVDVALPGDEKPTV